MVCCPGQNLIPLLPASIPYSLACGFWEQGTVLLQRQVGLCSGHGLVQRSVLGRKAVAPGCLQGCLFLCQSGHKLLFFGCSEHVTPANGADACAPSETSSSVRMGIYSYKTAFIIIGKSCFTGCTSALLFPSLLW